MFPDLLPPATLVPQDVQDQASGVPITEAQLVELLRGERVQIVRVVTRTLPRFQRGSPFPPRSVISLCVRTGFIGADYLRVVRQQRKREGLFDLAKMTAQCRPAPIWRGKGKHVPGHRHLVEHVESGLLYLVLYPQTNCFGEPVEAYRAFFLAESYLPVPAELVKKWRVVSRGSNFPRTQKKIPWRMPCLGSIVSITIGGTPYALIGERSQPLSAAKRKAVKRERPTKKEREAAVRLQSPLDPPAARNNSRNSCQRKTELAPETQQQLQLVLEQAAARAPEATGFEWCVSPLKCPPPELAARLTAKLNNAERAGWSVQHVLPIGGQLFVCARRPSADPPPGVTR